LPSRQDWDNLGQSVRGVRNQRKDEVSWLGGAAERLKARSGWKDNDGKSGNGTDEYGFSALPGGERSGYGGSYEHNGMAGRWWTSAEVDNKDAYSRSIDYKYDFMSEFNHYGKTYGFSVRCVQPIGSNTAQPAPQPAYQQSTPAQQPGGARFTDKRDGKTYRTAKMPDGKVWMAENLNYQPQSGNSWCHNDDNSKCAKYGRLYDWNTAKTVCPAGWHLPSRGEWENLGKAAGGTKNPKHDCWDGASKKLKARSGWDSWGGDKKDKYSGNGTDDYGFSAMPGGTTYGGGSGGKGHQDPGKEGRWWTSTARTGEEAYSWDMGYVGDDAWVHDPYMRNGLSVRCVED